MAKCIYICSKKNLPAFTEKLLNEICNRLAPDNIRPRGPKIVVNGTTAYAVLNPTRSIKEKRNSLLLGQLFEKNEDWDVPLTEFPDGSYALFRNDENHFEIVSDPLASRTIWYYLDQNTVIASTSQRAIVMFAGSFELEKQVMPWMLSTGCLGPSFSWDKRIKRVAADSSVILDKKSWSLSSKSNPIIFHSAKGSDTEHRKNLSEALNKTFRFLNLDYSDWALPLSGGVDSRGILCLLSANSNVEKLETITWGLESSLKVKGNDAYVAKELADNLKISHKYYHTDLSTEPVDKIINRFVRLGEGRIDHLSAYMDGFKIWKTLYEDGIEGTIRGDESFGWLRVSSALSVRTTLNFALCTDYSNLKDYQRHGFPSQEIPQYLEQRDGETLNEWRDRLYQEYRTPTMLAALADLKLAYVEQISPFFSKKILQVARQMPDHLRTEKKLFTEIVASIGPKIDFATSEATASPGEILKQKDVVDYLKNELRSEKAKQIFPGDFLQVVLKEMKAESRERIVKRRSFSLRSFAKKYFPLFLIRMMRKVSAPRADPNVLAFRVFLICKMNEILREDARIGKKFHELTDDDEIKGNN